MSVNKAQLKREGNELCTKSKERSVFRSGYRKKRKDLPFEILCCRVTHIHTHTHKCCQAFTLLSFSLSLSFFHSLSLPLFAFGLAGLLELSLNQLPFDFESSVAHLIEESQPESPAKPQPLGSMLRSAATLQRRVKLRSRKKKRNNKMMTTATTTTSSSLLDAATATKKKLSVVVQSTSASSSSLLLQQRKSSAATLARNAEQRDDGKLQCPQCPNAYTRLSALKRHIEFECGMLENFYCEVCDAGFKRKDSLNRHCKVKKHITKYLC